LKPRRRHSHEGPNERESTARDSSSLVRDLDRNVFIALGDDDFDRREVLALDAVSLDDSAKRVLQNLEKDVIL